MAKTALKGGVVNTIGELPAIGSVAPKFEGVNTDLSVYSSDQLKGSKVILNIFPSIDTGVCATAARKFNEEASQLDNTKVVCISMDLPFALKRFCAAEGLKNVITLSAFRSNFGKDYGVQLIDSGMKGLFARSVVVLDEEGKVVYTQLVPEITTEPDYESAIKAVSAVTV